MSSISEFYNQVAREAKGSTTGSLLLDKSITFTDKSTTLVNLESYAGNTAICLQLAYGALQADCPMVCFVDGFNALQYNRINDIKDRLIICRPDTTTELFSVVSELKGYNIAYILDSSYLIEGWDLGSGLENLARSIMNIDTSSTVICGSPKRYSSNFWTNYVAGNVKTTRYIGGVKVGHITELTGPLGKSSVYIEYTNGRISKGYDIAYKQMLNGVQRSGVFSYEGKEVRGFWNFVDYVDGLF